MEYFESEEQMLRDEMIWLSHMIYYYACQEENTYLFRRCFNRLSALMRRRRLY